MPPDIWGRHTIQCFDPSFLPSIVIDRARIVAHVTNTQNSIHAFNYQPQIFCFRRRQIFIELFVGNVIMFEFVGKVVMGDDDGFLSNDIVVTIFLVNLLLEQWLFRVTVFSFQVLRK